MLSFAINAQEEKWRNLQDRALELFKKENYLEAESVAKEALKVAEETFGPEHPNTARAMGDLASIYFAQDKLNEAEKLFQKEIEIEKIEVRYLRLLCR